MNETLYDARYFSLNSGRYCDLRLWKGLYFVDGVNVNEEHIRDRYLHTPVKDMHLCVVGRDKGNVIWVTPTSVRGEGLCFVQDINDEYGMGVPHYDYLYSKGYMYVKDKKTLFAWCLKNGMTVKV